MALGASVNANPRDGGAWWAAVYGVAQSRTRLKRLSSSRLCLCADENSSVNDVVIKLTLAAICACVLSCFSHVWLFVTLWTVARQAPRVHGILQARILKWVAMFSSRKSSWPRDLTRILVCLLHCRQNLYRWATGEAQLLYKPSQLCIMAQTW